ncbi:cytochrome P450 [Mycena crocata]|nr:cytochrome P450 [Mycena crocata]
MASHSGYLGACLCVLVVVFWAARLFRASRQLVSYITGPKSPSWIYGNLPQLLLSKEYGEHEFQWQKTYGAIYAVTACFGERRLMVSDPTAIKHVLNSPVFVHGVSQRKAADVLFGVGNLFVAEADKHRRLRNIMNPAFSAKSIRGSLPRITETARKLVDCWESLGFPGNTVDITRTLHDAAVDVIGEAILEHPIDALTGQSGLSKIQRTLVDTVSSATKFGQLVDVALPYVPGVIFRLAFYLPLAGIRMIQDYHRGTDELCRRLVLQTRAEEASGIDPTFITRLVQATAAGNSFELPEDEIAIHLRSILIAGDDTTGSTLGWVLYKLAQMQDLQHELRREIQVASTIDGEPDHDNMPLLNAIINEVLRLYCPLPFEERVASADCVLPLTEAITTTAGTQISEIPIRKGQFLYVAITSYHRLTSFWGTDAHEFRPSRWFEKEPCKGPALGPHASLLTFSTGPGVCLGWRLAILELQVFVTEIVRRFTLSLPENDSVRPCFGLTLVAKTADGVQALPIHVETVA